ncbi:IS1634 family transposase [Hippea maritima]|uniref:Transposase IS4 family protein n=1 Tax=Hippea maritima (strain ATCC 700847 / DSM 10411 / MH2) TaxID=760142 RepID=F2LVE2_HIPMA|nr:IS1634 family transposase [Hippea maritima]AEA33726.1 transposase IS4 family protein [Hippea maritima DSM 10411]
MLQQKAVIKNMDHLGLIAGMIDELKIAETIDDEIPSSSKSKNLSYGEATKAMILNGLGYVNKQLYLTPLFFKDKPLKRLFGRDVDFPWFNDDALGRTLDKLFEYGVSELYEKIASRALKILNLTPSTIHLDSASFHLDGKYPNQKTKEEKEKEKGKVKERNGKEEKGNNSEGKWGKGGKEEEYEPTPVFITQGYSRDHHPELNQVVLNLIVEHKAGIPIWMKPADGNKIDTQAFANIVKEHINSLKNANNTKTKVIADAALFSSKTMEEFKKNNMLFISRVPSKLKQAKEILKNHNEEEFIQLDENYQAIQYTVDYEGMKQQWVLYKSSYAKSRGDKTIKKEYQEKEKQETKLIEKLQKRAFFCEADARKAFEEKTKKLECIMISEAKLISKPKYKTRGRPKPNAKPDHYEYYWIIETKPNEEYLKQKQNQKSGLFILATNDMTLSAKELLDEYKSQQRIERGFRFLKSPEFLSDAMFLKNPKRIEAMLMIMTLSLLVYSALEYRIRSELKNQNKSFPNQLGKPIQNPTARWVFENFFAIHLLLLNGQEQIVGLENKHRLILELLGSNYMGFYGINGERGAE